jgi:hypothetical protein
MNSRVLRTLALLTLSALSGCAIGPFHRKTASMPPPPPEAPELSQTPLYSPEMSENNPKLPALPQTSTVAVVQAPPPPAPKTHHPHKPKPTTSTVATNGKVTPASTAGGSGATTQDPPSAGNMAGTAADKTEKSKDASPPTNVAEAPASGGSPIGELTSGSSEDSAQTSHQTEDLIKSTRDGLDGIRRNLSTDEKKTQEEILTFLRRAQQALKNGDVDGAFGLAKKASILLEELTQK